MSRDQWCISANGCSDSSLYDGEASSFEETTLESGGGGVLPGSGVVPLGGGEVPSSCREEVLVKGQIELLLTLVSKRGGEWGKLKISGMDGVHIVVGTSIC